MTKKPKGWIGYNSPEWMIRVLEISPKQARHIRALVKEKKFDQAQKVIDQACAAHELSDLDQRKRITNHAGDAMG